MNSIFEKMAELVETLSNKQKLIEISNFKSHIKINNLEMPPPIVSFFTLFKFYKFIQCC